MRYTGPSSVSSPARNAAPHRKTCAFRASAHAHRVDYGDSFGNRAHRFLSELLVVEARYRAADKQCVLGRVHTQFAKCIHRTSRESILRTRLNVLRRMFGHDRNFPPWTVLRITRGNATRIASSGSMGNLAPPPKVSTARGGQRANKQRSTGASIQSRTNLKRDASFEFFPTASGTR